MTSGLGLATVYGIVKQHGGHVAAYSEPGRGTTMKIYLPRVGEDAISVAPAAPVSMPGQGSGTVLVVEDDDPVRQLACGILASHGYRVLEAAGPSDALRIVAEEKQVIDLLLTDVVMPEMNGRQLYERISEICRTIRVLYMSGYTENAIAHHGVLKSGVDLVRKPFAVAELLGRVQAALNGEPTT